MEASRRGRFDHHHHDAVPVVDQAECCTAAQACRSCVGATLADAIAVGCCPCAVVSLLGLALVRAPLAVARRCLRRLRRRWAELRRKKRRVRDDMGPAADTRPKCRYGGCDVDAALKGAWALDAEVDARGEVATWARASSSSSSASGRLDAEKVWMEMYRVGQWGFGRLSISVTPPPITVSPDGGRKDVDLRCESCS